MSSQLPEQNQHPQQQNQRPSTGGAQPQASRMRRWADIVEQQITEAREHGDFDHLPGLGKPLRLEQNNPHAGEKALAYSLLKNNGMAPPEIERGKEIQDELQQAEALLARLHHQRNTLSRRTTVFASERRAYNVLRANTERRYTEQLRTINSKILTLNISAPAAFHQRKLDVEAKLRAFQEEFPPLAE